MFARRRGDMRRVWRAEEWQRRGKGDTRMFHSGSWAKTMSSIRLYSVTEEGNTHSDPAPKSNDDSKSNARPSLLASIVYHWSFSFWKSLISRDFIWFLWAVAWSSRVGPEMQLKPREGNNDTRSCDWRGMRSRGEWSRGANDVILTPSLYRETLERR